MLGFPKTLLKKGSGLRKLSDIWVKDVVKKTRQCPLRRGH